MSKLLPFSCTFLSSKMMLRMHKQEFDPRMGLPRPRQQWVARREAAGHTTPTQMYYAKQGVVTEEMAFVAARESMPVEFVRSEVRMELWCSSSCKFVQQKPTVELAL